VKWFWGRCSVFTATASSFSTFSSLLRKELMLKPEEIPCLDKGFVVFTMVS
jgi:hypothetical protein